MTWLTEFLLPPNHWTMFWHGLVWATVIGLVCGLIGVGVLHLIWWLQDLDGDD